MPCRLLPALVLCATACERPAPLIDNVHRTPAATMVAIPTTKGLLLATVTPHDVRADQTLPETSANFGWLDERTLIVADTEVTRYVEGRRVEVTPLSDRWGGAGLVFTRAGQVWLQRCGGPALPTEEGCDDFRWLPIASTPGREQAQPPAGITMPRDANDRWRPWPRPTPVPAPAGFNIARASVQQVDCTDGERTVAYPNAAWSFSAPSGYVFTSARWVQTVPPIFEIALDITTPIGTTSHSLEYVRACEPRPLDAYVSLGAGVWAAYTAVHDSNGYIETAEDGTWSFHAGETLIGTLRGNVGLRASRPLP